MEWPSGDVSLIPGPLLKNPALVQPPEKPPKMPQGRATYFIWNDEVVPPHERLYTAHVRKALDVGAMQRAADLLVGELDFAAFTANANRVVESTVRTIFSLKVTQRGRKVALPGPFVHALNAPSD